MSQNTTTTSVTVQGANPGDVVVHVQSAEHRVTVISNTMTIQEALEATGVALNMDATEVTLIRRDEAGSPVASEVNDLSQAVQAGDNIVTGQRFKNG